MTEDYRYTLDLKHVPTGKIWSTNGRAHGALIIDAISTALHSGRIRIRNQMSQAGIADRENIGPFILNKLIIEIDEQQEIKHDQ